jgi:hypothetical protein
MPTVPAELQWVLMAFFDLSSRRPILVGSSVPVPIPTAEILAWLDLRGIEDTDDRCDFARTIGAMDATWREVRAKQCQPSRR